jgi:hypothetical protein
MKTARRAKKLLLPRLWVVVALLLAVGEEFPFSRFPMYASFDPVADYYYVAEVTGKPLPCLAVFGSSTAKLKKMYRSRLEALTAARGANEADATAAERRQAGEELIDWLRASAIERGRAPLPGPVRLIHIEVRGSSGGGFDKPEELVAEK